MSNRGGGGVGGHVSLSIAKVSCGFQESEPSKLCRYICKALRGNNGQNLKTEENF